MFKKFLFFLIIFSIGLGLGNSYFKKSQESQNVYGKNSPEAFVSEVYDKIMDNYWDNISQTQLLESFKLAFDKNGGTSYQSKFGSKDNLIKAVASSAKSMNEEDRNKFISNMTSNVLASLSPLGRSGLYTTKQEEQLKNTVENINPQKDLYKDLGVSKDASGGAIEAEFQKKKEELANDNSPQAQQKLKEIAYAKEVLTQKDTKGRYDQNGVEPTIFTKVFSSTLYLQFKKFSPTSYDEFVKTFESYKDNSSINNLIFDLRGNIGGSIDAAPYFLGHFIGKGQTAFDFYHKGEYLPFKTPTDKAPSITKYKQVVILIDNNTQSSAEIMAATFKKYHVGVLIGTPSKGWGTVERVFSLDNQFDKSTKYSLFLVHSITLREDNLPIEGRGVEPDVNFKNSDWQAQLFSYFRNQELTDAVSSIK